MSALARCASRLAGSAAAVDAANRALAEVWRDRRGIAYRDEVTRPIEAANRRLRTALDDADRDVERVFQTLRQLGANLS
ncbi:MAG TPA: hypothetical protein VM677_28190 [Actinokineospora sp.]|nr:hypothetical protein [Actinokineospora sp.]